MDGNAASDGAVPEGDDGLVEIEVSPTTRRMLNELAKQLGATPSAILEEAIRTYALDA